jgi:meso-butanediol dehydrogenase/(S,S)-butanediol dehydrogenase/diacetyl reductase
MTNTVVVTGAGSGIGRAIATVLAERGWQVVVTDIDADAAERVSESLPKAAGQRHESARLNVSSPAEATSVADAVADRLGLHAWVSNAGISFMHRFVDAPVERFDQTMEVNLKGVFVCGQAAARAMIRTGARGSIVNTASMAGKQGRVPFLSDYVASKFGVVGLTQAAGAAGAARGRRTHGRLPAVRGRPLRHRRGAGRQRRRLHGLTASADPSQ